MRKVLPPGLKRGAGVLIRWSDALASGGGWTAVEDVNTAAADITTIGVFVEQTPSTVAVALSMDTEGAEVNQVLVIPLGWIQSAQSLAVRV